MLDISRQQIDPPTNDDDFEDLCLDLIRELWKDPTAQKNGRRGHRQNGVDIFGCHKPTECGGIQCKVKERLTNKKISTKKDIDDQIDLAKTFEPKITRYIIATTAPRDPEIQKHALIVSLEHAKEGLFSVEVWSWDEIHDYLSEAPITAKKYFPGSSLPQITELVRDIDEIKKGQQTILENQTEQKQKSDTILSAVENTGITNQKIEEFGGKIKKDAVLHEKINALRDQIAKNPKSALDGFTKLKTETWATADSFVKFRILTNIAVAQANMGDDKNSSQNFIEALEYNPDDEKALINAATGYLLNEEYDEVQRITKKILEKNLTHPGAYAMMLHAISRQKSLNVAVESIPEIYRETSEVAYAIATEAEKNEDLDKALFWLEKAQKTDTKKDVTTRAVLAGVLLKIAIQNPILIADGHITSKAKEFLTRASELYNEVWKEIAGTELREFRIAWLINKSQADRLLGKKDEALAAIATAIEIVPGDPAVLKQRAVLQYEDGKIEEAISTLQKIGFNRDVPDTLLLEAGFLREQKKYSEAITVLQQLITQDIPFEILDSSNRLLFQLYLDTQKFEEAKIYIASKPTPWNVLDYIDEARFFSIQGNTEKATESLMKAKEIKEKDSREIFELAQMFYSFEHFAEAAELFEKIVDKKIDSSLTRRLLNCYYRSGKLNEALEICKELRSVYGPLRFIVEFESSIYEEIGDLSKSKEIVTEYLKTHPDDIEIKIRFAVINFRTNNYSDLDEFLNSKINIKELQFDSLLQLINLYEARNLNEKALELAYEIRRDHFNNERAHLAYVGLFFRSEREPNPFIATEAKENTVVVIKNELGQLQNYILEEREGSELSRGEINSKHTLYKLFLGKKVGNVVEVPRNGFPPEKLEVVEIKNKYVHALHETLNNFGIMFPSSSALKGFVTTGEAKEDIKNILDQVAKQSEYQNSIIKYYKEGKMTIGGLAELSGKDPLKTWGGMISKPDVGIRSSLGTKEERMFSLRAIHKNPRPKLIIDVISLLTIHGIEMADIVSRVYGKFGISRSSIDLLRESVEEKKSFESKGFMSIFKEGDQFYREEMTKEEVKKNTAYMEEVLQWSEKNCDIIPSEAALHLDKDRLDLLRRVLGRSFADSLLISSEGNRMLFSEDERLRTIAKNEFGIDGIWTQLLLMEMVEKEEITKSDYSKAVIRLINSNYYHTSISKDILIEAGIQTNWELKNPLEKVISLLQEGKSDEDSSIRVASEFIYALWNQKIPQTKKELIINKIFDSLIYERKFVSVIKKLVFSIKKDFLLVPIQAEQVMATLRAWGKTKAHLLTDTI